MIFFIGIATLGVGSAVPSSNLYAMTMKQCWLSDLKRKKKLIENGCWIRINAWHLD
jgi:hypothetical protein